ncbi:MAG: FadR/GntR family transcriptional regulator [Pseudomonadota bacterium]
MSDNIFNLESKMLGNRESLSSQLKKQLLKKIEDQSYPPGERIPTEAHLCSQYGVSRTVVREAIASLRADGLLKAKQGIGVFVSAAPRLLPFELSNAPEEAVREVIHILELRLSVEMEAAFLAAERRDDDQLKDIHDAIDRIESEASSESGDSGQGDFRFHLAIAQATNNPYFAKFLNFLGPQVIPRLKISMTQPYNNSVTDYHSKIQDEHQNILRAIEKQDSVAARDAMRVHLSSSLARYRQAHP